MSNSSTGQVLGAATVAGGISVLADTAGFPFANILGIIIKISFILVAVSFILTQVIKHAKKNQSSL